MLLDFLVPLSFQLDKLMANKSMISVLPPNTEMFKCTFTPSLFKHVLSFCGMPDVLLRLAGSFYKPGGDVICQQQ